jgi:hypothetical protein
MTMMWPLTVEGKPLEVSARWAEFEACEAAGGGQRQGDRRAITPKAEISTIMTETWITDLTHFLTPHGSIAPAAGPARQLAERLTRLVAAATAPPGVASDNSPVQCWRRPGRQRCAGAIETDLDPATGAVVWWCPVCGQQGQIHHWQGSLWDGTARLQRH